MTELEVLALPKYGRLAASSRCRFFNYVPLLRERNIAATVSPLLSDEYVQRRLSGAKIDYVDVTKSYLSRLCALANSRSYDVLWIEGELFPRWPVTAVRALRILGKPFVVDLDDAIFHSYDLHPSPLVRALLGGKIDAIFRRATAVVVGNDYLAERARRAGAKRVVTVPTGVDHRAYASRALTPHHRLTFGWIGSPATEHYLQTIAPDLEEVCRSLGAKLRLIGLKRHRFNRIDVELLEWSEDTEIDDLACCDIGLAPLSDGPWERGKCGLKAIQYMALGIPVLAADVGVLPTIVRHGETGFVYRDRGEFRTFARQLAEEPDLRRRLGAAGKERVASCYSIEVWADVIAGVLREAALATHVFISFGLSLWLLLRNFPFD
jgi:glycosyltransferase involved in cell wall biosynthesis